MVTTRSQAITTKLRERLIEGYYEPHAHLNEVDLAAELGTSRTPVRAALNYLASEGLVVYRPNAGFIVRAITPAYIAGVYEVRSSLEGLASRLAAEIGLSDAEREALDRNVAETDAVIATGREELADELRSLNNDFHRLIIEASGNEHLSETLRRTRNLPGVDKVKNEVFDFHFIARAQEDHHYLLRAIKRGQGARAEALSQEHVHRGAQRLLEFFRERGCEPIPDKANNGKALIA
ncbi:GntR family transcriptional regulator [Acuticoccus sediminis]|uniref:GntR family transcriptional regulator n=1 Tax=Acuticoccus sediminis TaxID=2184697 RepID=A0A8B2NW40_9HYPH|nr:GntR family transcriptional regulator [Acuticoccus sediminis]RAI02003.1 GntR family transcriptional regulator [Acuticoccus sediminis]